MVSIIIMLLLISLLVVVHELGHFSVAKFFGVKVDRFGIGLPFGPILYERLIGQTKFVIHAMLLGGYVAFPEDDPENKIDKDDPDLLANRPIWQRTAVVSAGVIANVLIAYILVMIAFYYTGGLPTNLGKVYLHNYSFENSPAKVAGLQIDDQLYAVNGVAVENADHFKRLVTINMEHDGKLDSDFYQKQLKILKSLNPSIKESTEILPQGTVIQLPKKQAIEPTVIEEKNSAPIISLSEPEVKLSHSLEELKDLKSVRNTYQYTANGQVTFENIVKSYLDGKHIVNLAIIRAGEQKTLAVMPNEQGYIGIQLRMVPVYKKDVSPFEFVFGCIKYSNDQAILMLQGLYKLISGKVPLQDLHGIVAITKIGGDIIEQSGIVQGLLLTALISIDLAIVNILPIPALDGGHLVFLLIEKIRGRPVEDKLRESISYYGFMFLIGFMLLVVANDIFALITGKF